MLNSWINFKNRNWKKKKSEIFFFTKN